MGTQSYSLHIILYVHVRMCNEHTCMRLQIEFSQIRSQNVTVSRKISQLADWDFALFSIYNVWVTYMFAKYEYLPCTNWGTKWNRDTDSYIHYTLLLCNQIGEKPSILPIPSKLRFWCLASIMSYLMHHFWITYYQTVNMHVCIININFVDQRQKHSLEPLENVVQNQV